MPVNRQTIRADGLTVGEALQRDREFLISMGVTPHASHLPGEPLPYDEQCDDFKHMLRDSVLLALDEFAERHGNRKLGWQDGDLANLFPALDKHAAALFDRLHTFKPDTADKVEIKEVVRDCPFNRQPLLKRKILDFKILIDGIHLATWRHQPASMTPFWLEDLKGKRIQKPGARNMIVCRSRQEMMERTLQYLPQIKGGK